MRATSRLGRNPRQKQQDQCAARTGSQQGAHVSAARLRHSERGTQARVEPAGAKRRPTCGVRRGAQEAQPQEQGGRSGVVGRSQRQGRAPRQHRFATKGVIIRPPHRAVPTGEARGSTGPPGLRGRRHTRRPEAGARAVGQSLRGSPVGGFRGSGSAPGRRAMRPKRWPFPAQILRSRSSAAAAEGDAAPASMAELEAKNSNTISGQYRAASAPPTGARGPARRKAW